MPKEKFYYLKAFIPACITFGPMFMIMGLSKLLFPWMAYVGVFILACGLTMLLRIVVGLEKMINELQEKT